jgi:hypothetical protein
MSGAIRMQTEVQRLREFYCQYHDYEKFIDPESGGFMRCRKCGKTVDCEDPEHEEGGM